MKLVFDMTNIKILHTAPTAQELLIDIENPPEHLRHVYSFRIEGMDDPLFLGSRRAWPELNLRRLYTWLKIQPPLTPSKMNDAAMLDLRQRIRAAIAASLRFEPSGLPILTSVVATVSTTPVSKSPRKANARRGTVGPIIHRVATEMWEAAGSPRDVSVILQLRQTIMKVLNDEHNIKINTSSNELGRWQKQLLTS